MYELAVAAHLKVAAGQGSYEYSMREEHEHGEHANAFIELTARVESLSKSRRVRMKRHILGLHIPVSVWPAGSYRNCPAYVNRAGVYSEQPDGTLLRVMGMDLNIGDLRRILAAL